MSRASAVRTETSARAPMAHPGGSGLLPRETRHAGERTRLEPDGAQNDHRDTVRILIVDDDQLYSESVRLALEAKGFEVTGIASCVTDAIQLSRSCEPDIVLMDLVLPDGDGIDAGRSILEHLPDTAVIAVSGLTDSHTITEAVKAGFSSYVPKGSSLAQLITCIETAASGQMIFPRDARPSFNGGSRCDDYGTLVSRTLTARERQILALIVEGASGPAIAEALSLSRNTVRTHVQNILTKLQVSSRLEAAAFAVRHGLVPDLRRNRTHASA